MPDVVGSRSAVASQRLQNAGFEVNIETVQSDTVPDDRVATQDPQPGEEATEGSTVTIIVSSGPGNATVPGVVGRKQDVAEDMMKEAGFKTDVRREPSDSVDEGRVISTQPGENTQLEKGHTVVLVVSAGPEQVSVPDVVGDSEDDARSALEGPACAPTWPRRSPRTRTRDRAAAGPGRGAKVDKGSTVALVVAKAPPASDVPDVVDDERDARRRRCAMRASRCGYGRRPWTPSTRTAS